MANNSGIFPLLALFSIAAFCVSCVRSQGLLGLFDVFSKKEWRLQNHIYQFASATSALTLVRSCGDSWLASRHLRSPAWSFGSLLFEWHVFNQFSTSGDAVSVDVTVGEAAGTAAPVCWSRCFGHFWFSVVFSGVGEATTSSTVAAGSLAWSDTWAVSAFAVWTDNRAKPLIGPQMDTWFFS